jgi:hypothetical protein
MTKRILIVVIAASLTGAAQAPAAPFADIVACASARTCKNMQPATMSWFDMVGIPVLTFTDGESRFAIAAPRQGRLSVWITMPGEMQASRTLTLGSEDKVLSASLGPMPGDGRAPESRTPTQFDAWVVTHKAFNSGESGSGTPAWGQEFKTFWEDQAKQAMVAIRRQIAK